MKIPISAYEPFTNQKGKLLPGGKPYESELFEELERFKTGYYKPLIDACRAIEDKDERTKYKAQYLPSFTLSAVVHTWREEKNIIAHTGIITMDIDPTANPHIEDW